MTPSAAAEAATIVRQVRADWLAAEPDDGVEGTDWLAGWDDGYAQALADIERRIREAT